MPARGERIAPKTFPTISPSTNELRLLETLNRPSWIVNANANEPAKQKVAFEALLQESLRMARIQASKSMMRKVSQSQSTAARSGIERCKILFK